MKSKMIDPEQLKALFDVQKIMWKENILAHKNSEYARGRMEQLDYCIYTIDTLAKL